jgi:REP element-mobilizing transposase RayT
MTNHRRNFVPGGCQFFTVNLAERKSRLLTDHVDSLRAAFRYARARHPFTVEAIVVLPDHLHSIWSLPDNYADYATRWRLIKATFSRALPAGERISPSRLRKGEREDRLILRRERRFLAARPLVHLAAAPSPGNIGILAHVDDLGPGGRHGIHEAGRAGKGGHAHIHPPTHVVLPTSALVSRVATFRNGAL